MNRCKALAKLLSEQNFPAISIHGGMKQEERLVKYKEFKDFKKRILVATDLFGRGMGKLCYSSCWTWIDPS